MCDEHIHPGLVSDPRLSRRGFGVMAAGLATAASPAFAAGAVEQSDVSVKTADGSCDAVLFHPKGDGKWPAVLVWPDIMGLRPVFRDLGARLAADGYTVLVVNPFYRSARAPVIGDNFNFGDAAQRAMLSGYRAAMTDAGVDNDARAFLAFLDAQKATDTARRAGVQGYCMGGSLSFRTAAAVPARIGAVGSFHGGNGLASDKPDSPLLLIPKTSAAFLVCQAQNDDAAQPATKDRLREAFMAAGKTATVEVYQANHGWCVPGSAAYNRAEAERAWTALLQLYKSQLV